jgi:hypothetical protein
MEPECLLLYSQENATGHRPEPDYPVHTFPPFLQINLKRAYYFSIYVEIS